MTFKLAIILAIALPAWYFSDMSSSSRVEAYVLPLIAFVSVLALALWVIEAAQKLGRNSKK
jgi:hypothetical protein